MRPASILVVDDQPSNLDLMEAILAPEGYDVRLADNGLKGLEMVRAAAPDVVLLDVMMPGINGYEVCKKLKSNPATRRIPVVLVTALNGDQDRIAGYESEADDFVTKPVSRPILLARVRNLLRMKSLNDKTEDLEAVIYTLAATVEAKDKTTQGHVYRMAKYSEWLAEACGLVLDMDAFRAGAILHDIGKIGIPESILCKPSALTPEEFEVMKGHPEIGARICRKLHNAGTIVPVVRHHHERWDGKGYPDGLAGEGIPLTARIVAVADSFDAMVADRVYRKGMPRDQAIKILEEGAGTQWDPTLVPIFIALLRDRAREIEVRRIGESADADKLAA